MPARATLLLLFWCVAPLFGEPRTLLEALVWGLLRDTTQRPISDQHYVLKKVRRLAGHVNATFVEAVEARLRTLPSIPEEEPAASPAESPSSEPKLTSQPEPFESVDVGGGPNQDVDCVSQLVALSQSTQREALTSSSCYTSATEFDRLYYYATYLRNARTQMPHEEWTNEIGATARAAATMPASADVLRLRLFTASILALGSPDTALEGLRQTARDYAFIWRALSFYIGRESSDSLADGVVRLSVLEAILTSSFAESREGLSRLARSRPLELLHLIEAIDDESVRLWARLAVASSVLGP